MVVKVKNDEVVDAAMRDAAKASGRRSSLVSASCSMTEYAPNLVTHITQVYHPLSHDIHDVARWCNGGCNGVGGKVSEQQVQKLVRMLSELRERGGQK